MKHRNIIIVGGGVAGLAAASRLHGHNVTLLEARDRFGGRIHTMNSNGQIVELGAEFVHGQSKSLLQAIEDADLQTTAASEKNQVFENGKFHPMDIWTRFGELTERIDPKTADESFLSFINRQKLSEREREMMLAFATGFNAAHADLLSTHSLLLAEYAAEQMGGDEQSRINQGYGALVDFLVAKAREAGADLRKSVLLRKINWESGHVEIEALHDGAIEHFSGDAAIITLPIGVLKSGSVVFQPSLPEKEEAIAGLEFGNVVKLTFVFKTYWWPEPNFGFIHSLPDAIPTWWSDARGPVLTGWAGGAKADALAQRSQCELDALGIEIVSRIFSVPQATVRRQLVEMHHHNWAQDPLTRGAYSYIPVNGLFSPKLLAAPVEETLFFAGEATAQDAQLGTVFAALDSGYRAAAEVAVGEPIAIGTAHR